jgi:hypothetical protein
MKSELNVIARQMSSLFIYRKHSLRHNCCISLNRNNCKRVIAATKAGDRARVFLISAFLLSVSFSFIRHLFKTHRYLIFASSALKTLFKRGDFSSVLGRHFSLILRLFENLCIQCITSKPETLYSSNSEQHPASDFSRWEHWMFFSNEMTWRYCWTARKVQG